MKELFNSILDGKPEPDENIIKLRRDYVGCTVDKQSLNNSSFNKFDMNNELLWVMEFNDGADLCTMEIGNNNNICMLRYATYIESPSDNFFLNCSTWYSKKVNYETKAIIEHEIVKMIESEVLTNKNALFDWLLNIGFDYDSVKHTHTPDMFMVGLASEFYDSGKLLAMNLITYSLYRKLYKLDIKVLNDMPYLCGRLELLDEFFDCIKVLGDKDKKIDAAVMTNIGVVLCDHLRMYDLAILCFESAMALDPLLSQPSANHLTATIKLMGKHLAKKEYAIVLKAGERAMALDYPILDHGFYGMLGLAYEAMGEIDAARETYHEALELNYDCINSFYGLMRVKTPHYQDDELPDAIANATAGLGHDDLIPVIVLNE